MAKIRALKQGDAIGIAAPASPFDRKTFMKGIHMLEELGFSVFYRHDIFDQNRYLAGSDKRRADEFTSLFSNNGVKAIMFARGGYGSQRIIPLLDIESIKRHPKPVVGFSDVTALLTYLRQEAEIPTYYGPVITQLGKVKNEIAGDYLFKVLTTEGPLGPMPMESSKTVKEGNTNGKIVGGCLSLINSSMGTPYEIETKDSILLIEDVGEKVYVLDRMLTQLKNSDKISECKGIIFGSLIPPPDEPHDVEAMIRDVLTDFHGPVIMNYPAGHTENFITTPLGAEAELKAIAGCTPSLTYTSGLLS